MTHAIVLKNDFADKPISSISMSSTLKANVLAYAVNLDLLETSKQIKITIC